MGISLRVYEEGSLYPSCTMIFYFFIFLFLITNHILIDLENVKPWVIVIKDHEI